MKRVLVTGANGFVGRNALAPLVDRGFEVHAAYIGSPLPVDGVVWHECNLLDVEATRELLASTRPSHLLHFAWNVAHGEYWTSAANLEWLEASLRLLRGFVESGGRRFVGVGTCAEYEWGSPLCTEGETPLRPASLYGVSKNALREVAESFTRVAGVTFAWGRIFLVYGPAEDRRRLIPSVMASLLDGEVAKCSAGENMRDFMHVADVGDAFAALTDSDVEGAVNIASGQPERIKDVVTQIASITEHPELLRLGALPERAGDPAILVADIRRLRDEVAWQPKLSLHEGLEQTIAWWRARLATEHHVPV